MIITTIVGKTIYKDKKITAEEIMSPIEAMSFEIKKATPFINNKSARNVSKPSGIKL